MPFQRSVNRIIEAPLKCGPVAPTVSLNRPPPAAGYYAPAPYYAGAYPYGYGYGYGYPYPYYYGGPYLGFGFGPSFYYGRGFGGFGGRGFARGGFRR